MLIYGPFARPDRAKASAQPPIGSWFVAVKGAVEGRGFATSALNP